MEIYKINTTETLVVKYNDTQHLQIENFQWLLITLYRFTNVCYK